MSTITAKTGLCNAAGEAIAAGAVIDGQKVYALTGGAKTGVWTIKYTDGTETALLAKPCHLTAIGGEVRGVLGVGMGANSGTMNGAEVVARFPASTFESGVSDAADLSVDNPAGYPVAMLYLNTETTEWASATGSVEVGFTPGKSEPVVLRSAV